MPEYKKILNNENAIEIDGKVVLSFDPRYKEYLKWRDENPKSAILLDNDFHQMEADNHLQRVFLGPRTVNQNTASPSKKSVEYTDSLTRIHTVSHTSKKINTVKKFELHWENGNIMVKGDFVGNLRVDGQWLWYYENGNIWSQVNYKYGFKNGLFKLYYKNGNIKVQGKYKKDERIGVWLINGKKRKYRNGEEL